MNAITTFVGLLLILSSPFVASSYLTSYLIGHLSGYLPGHSVGISLAPPNIVFASGTILASFILLIFTFGSFNNSTDMKNAHSAVQSHAARNSTAEGNTTQNRLIYHASPLTLAYNNITQSSHHKPASFNREKFEAGLAGWSDYSLFTKSSGQSDMPQPLHTFMEPSYYLPLSELNREQTTAEHVIEPDQKKHPRRYDPLPGTPSPWRWTDNVAQIKQR